MGEPLRLEARDERLGDPAGVPARHAEHLAALLETVLDAAEREQVPLEARLELCSGGHDWAWWQPEMLTALAALLRGIEGVETGRVLSV